MPSLYQIHANEWRDCRRCELHRTRCKVVLAKGKLPCDVLFIGEAPGESEDVTGTPFIGPAGRLLDEMIANAGGYRELRLAYTTVVACIPRGEDGDKMMEPDDSHAEACQPRLVEIVKIADPRLIVQVGTFAETWTQSDYKHSPKFHKWIPKVKIVHPAAILRARVDQKDYQKQRNVIALRDALELLSTEGK